jgi:gamma-glutamyltranspeptidase/glutathione hydrolase
MLVRSSNGTYEFIDFREVAPANSFESMYTANPNLSLYGGLASGVPGELRGLERLHTGYGKLSWKTVVAPAVKVARYGFKVTEDMDSYFKSSVSGIDDFLAHDTSFAIDFAPNGTRVGLGDIMTRKRYANTLETIGEKGVSAFYTGAIANATIQALKRTGGNMTLDDLKNYKVAIRKPAEITYKGYKIRSGSAPSGGVVALSALKIFEGFQTVNAANINSTTHFLDESMRFAYGERTQLGDPSFIANLTQYQANMLSEKTAAEIRAKISPTMAFNVSYYDPLGIESLETPGTSHIVTADVSGLAISLTTTINTFFGSRVCVPETGVIMNNEMNDFSIPGASNAFGYIPSVANYVRPGKRPLSSISPTIIETANGALYFVIGAAGGSRIITSTIQNIWNVLDKNMTAPQALIQARLHDQLVPATTSFEMTGKGITGYSNATVEYLRSLGHNITWVAPGQSTAQGIRITANGTFEAASEPRQANSGGFAI